MSTSLRVELEPLGVRVVTSICGSADTPIFSEPGGPMELPDTPYCHGVQDTAWKEQMDRQRQATNVNVLAESWSRTLSRRPGVFSGVDHLIRQCSGRAGRTLRGCWTG